MKQIIPAGIVAGALVYAFTTWVNMPIVQISATTTECVSVSNGGDCNNLPEKYVTEWVR